MSVQHQRLIVFAFYAWMTQEAHDLYNKHPMFPPTKSTLSIHSSIKMQRIPFRHIPKRTFFTLRTKPLTLPHPGPPTLQNERVDEERLFLYNSKSFYPVKPGEILGDKYQALVKLGWGTTSTVWLAKDVNRFVYCLTMGVGSIADY